MNEADKSYLLIDEMPSVHPCLQAAVYDAEKQGLYEFGMLSPHYYYIIQNGQINTCIDRSSFTASKLFIRKILAKMHVVDARKVYYCAPVIE